MMKRVPRMALPAALLLAANCLTATIAVAQDQEEKEESASTEQAKAAAPEQAPALPSQTFASTGSAVRIENLGINITPPSGWEVSSNSGSLSLIMSEPKDPTPSYDKPKYQRNITVAAIYHASPIDEKRATELQAELVKNFGADSSVSNFQIVEHKFFNYKGSNDGLIVYSSLNIGEYPMMQMHVLVSGQDKQFLLTYTDLAERFSNAGDKGFEKAWNSMVSIEVTGATPSRQAEYMRYGALVGGLLLLCMVGFLINRRAKKVDYGTEADSLIDGESESSSITTGFSGSMIATLAGGWKLESGSGNEGAEVSGFEFSNFGVAPRTQKTEYVSNY